ncbi:hypothetical protein [Portibacter marinus]|uniref:hypothetical protein n=1 Tax=Portibacter marinus TaxID=2898660 RepID=UPI001F1E4E54|nr:hypothetical protein [Portibacter marinus]
MDLRTVGILSFFIMASWGAFSQNDRAHHFIGINPSVTVEHYYEAGEWDINILPLVYQKTLSKRWDLRLNSIINYGLRKEKNLISHVGLELVIFGKWI